MCLNRFVVHVHVVLPGYPEPESAMFAYKKQKDDEDKQIVCKQ